jgi:hypothetical protein
MIPGKIVRFLEQHANTGVAGIRDRNLVPAGCRVSGWQVHPDGRTVSLMIPDPRSDRVIASLEDNGHIAVTLGEHQTHETYQLKGRYVRHRAVEAGDLALVDRFRERHVRSIRSEIPHGIPESYVGAIAVPYPAIVVDMDVLEVYVQTPGPGAGARLYPPVDPAEKDGMVGAP